jgi:hypothetical protein
VETTLHLLTKDGALRVAFSPRLAADQYDELVQIVEAHSTPTRYDLREAIQAAAWRWGNTADFEDGTTHTRANPW